MSDEELVKRFDVSPLVIKAPKEDTELERIASEGLTGVIVATETYVSEFLNALKSADIRGIGKITLKKLGDFAKENGYI
ncbi:MAG: hypothetical protein NC299_08970 [Lachnospiraceae bacterium]|nr:hypothetical protein [Lachnospiraceae bacterium]